MADDESPKPNEDSRAEGSQPAQSAGGAPAAKQIKRVKENEAITKTKLDIDALDIDAREVLTAPNEDRRAEGAQPAQPAGGAAAAKQIKRVKENEAITKTKLDIDALDIDARDMLSEPNEDSRAEGAQAAQPAGGAPAGKQIKRVKENEAITKTKLDIDACRDVFSNTAEHVISKKLEEIELAKSQPSPAVPVKEIRPIEDYRIASKCSSSWESMTGPKGCARVCGKCLLLVYDFENMEIEEAEQIIFQKEGKEKSILYRRADGKFLTQDCPDAAAKKQKLLILASVFLLFLVGGTFILLFQSSSQNSADNHLTQSVPSQNSEPSEQELPIASAVQPVESSDNESNNQQQPRRLEKTKFSYDRDGYVKRIKFLKSKGYLTARVEKALKQIDADINAGKHRLHLEAKVQELGEALGLLKPAVDPIIKAADTGAEKNDSDPTGKTDKKNDSSDDVTIPVGFSASPPKNEKELQIYNSCKISDSRPLLVREIVAHSAADKVGLRFGDRIVSIDKDTVDGLTLEQAREKLAGDRITIGIRTSSAQINAPSKYVVQIRDSSGLKMFDAGSGK